MYRIRNRPKYSDDELKEMYPVPHDHMRWPEHTQRMDVTLRLARDFIDNTDFSGADLSCGSNYLLDSLSEELPVRYPGDFAPGYYYQGPIEQTIHEIPKVDIFFCCETIEHLDDPDGVLYLIREKSHKLVLSTPAMTWEDENPEHYWSWDQEAVQDMLLVAGWEPVLYDELLATYRFQIWGCI